MHRKYLSKLGIDENKLIPINEVYARYPGEIGLMPDGVPTNEQAMEFINFANEVKELIMKEFNS